MHKKAKLIIFDLDGTLIDTMGGFADLAGELMKVHYGWSFEEGRKRYLETSGIPFFQQLEALCPNDEKNPVVVESFEKKKIGVFMKEPVSEKTVETLLTLRDLEIRTAISSNNFHDLVKEFVHRENVPIDLVLGFKPGFSKGSAHFNYLKDYFGTRFGEMLFVGDSLTDARTAKENKIQFAAKIGTFSERDFRSEMNSTYVPMIFEIHEILDILEVA